MSNQRKGTYDNPYSYIEYEEMVREFLWTCGWIVNNNEKYYITVSGEPQLPNAKGEKRGSYQNPFSPNVYYEMYNNYLWPGGYVQDPDEIRYYNKHDGTESASGCGSSSGSGSGCGCGGSNGAHLSAGSGRKPLDASTYIEIVWGSGYFGGLNQSPSLSATLVRTLSTTGEEMSIQLVPQWLSDYVVIITGPTPLTYQIPLQYRQ